MQREYQVDLDALQELLDREAQFADQSQECNEETKENQGVFDYLAQFKVAELKNTGKACEQPQQAEGLDLEKLVEEDILPYFFKELAEQQAAAERAKEEEKRQAAQRIMMQERANLKQDGEHARFMEAP